MSDLRKEKIAAFTAWAAEHISGDEKGEAQIFLDRLFQAFGQRGLREAGALSAYRFDPAADLLAQLLALNLSVAARLDAGQPATPPGIPPDYPEPQRLVSGDCIQP